MHTLPHPLAFAVVVSVLGVACDPEPYRSPGDGVVAPVATECLGCHRATAVADGAEASRGFATTHFDDWQPAEDGGYRFEETSMLEGYVLDAAVPLAPEGVGYVTRGSDGACAASCHQGHAAEPTIRRQWLLAGHADVTSAAFDHSFSSGGCAKCHSGIGLAAYLSAANTSYPNWNAPAAGQPGHAITCNACHDAQGYPTAAEPRLRLLGDVSLVSGGAATFTVDATLPAGRSAICIVCHQSRESGASLHKVMVGSGQDPYDGVDGTMTDLSFVNSHYALAGAMLYGLKGYELPGKRYTPGNVFHQGQLCTGCHMAASADERLGGHTFSIARDGVGNVAVCQRCHGDVTALAAVGVLRDLDGDGVAGFPVDELGGLAELLAAALAAQGIYYNAHTNPYFFKVADAASQTRANASKTWTERQLIAAFNLQFVTQDAGAYAHNFRYAAQLLRDAYEQLTGTALAGLRPGTVEDRPATIYENP